MPHFLTAVFGEPYRRAGQALARSFARHAPGAKLSIFTDLDAEFAAGDVVKTSYEALIETLPEFYRNPTRQFRNVFRFQLFRRLQAMCPGEDLCWIDADMLVFGDLAVHLKPGHVCVMAHGRRPGQQLDMGGGLIVPGERYAIGGLCMLPAGPALDWIEKTLIEMPNWPDGGGPLRHMADQVALNHLVARSDLPVHWLTDDRRYIFNLELADAWHPVVGDPGLARIELVEGRPSRDGRRIEVLCWIKSKLDAHLRNSFSSFRPEVASMLQDLYA